MSVVHIFEIRDGRAFPTVEVLLIPVFKNIWDKDTEEGKPEAIKVFSYIHFLLSPMLANFYLNYLEEDRPAVIKKDLWGDPYYTSPIYEDSDIIDAIVFYKGHLEESTLGYSTLNNALKTAENLEDHLKNIDFTERTKGGAMVIKARDVTAALKEIPEVVKTLKKARKEIHEEVKDQAKTRNERVIGPYER
jgi:hypothetical protein